MYSKSADLNKEAFDELKPQIDVIISEYKRTLFNQTITNNIDINNQQAAALISTSQIPTKKDNHKLLFNGEQNVAENFKAKLQELSKETSLLHTESGTSLKYKNRNTQDKNRYIKYNIQNRYR